MTKLSNKAFAIMAVGPETKKYFGITVDEVERNAYKFVWAFPIDKEKAHMEGYDSESVHGSIDMDINFPGCPYCHSKKIYFLFLWSSSMLAW